MQAELSAGAGVDPVDEDDARKVLRLLRPAGARVAPSAVAVDLERPLTTRGGATVVVRQVRRRSGALGSDGQTRGEGEPRTPQSKPARVFSVPGAPAQATAPGRAGGVEADAAAAPASVAPTAAVVTRPMRQRRPERRPTLIAHVVYVSESPDRTPAAHEPHRRRWDFVMAAMTRLQACLDDIERAAALRFDLGDR